MKTIKLIIGGATWTVRGMTKKEHEKYRGDYSTLFGVTIKQLRLILIKKGISLDTFHKTLLHELIHAICLELAYTELMGTFAVDETSVHGLCNELLSVGKQMGVAKL